MAKGLGDRIPVLGAEFCFCCTLAVALGGETLSGSRTNRNLKKSKVDQRLRAEGPQRAPQQPGNLTLEPSGL